MAEMMSGGADATERTGKLDGEKVEANHEVRQFCGGNAIALLQSCRPLRSRSARYRNYWDSVLNAPRSLSTSYARFPL